VPLECMVVESKAVEGSICQGIGRDAGYGKPCTIYMLAISFKATEQRKQPHRRLETVESHIGNDCIKC
jgi:hypothetical protein